MKYSGQGHRTDPLPIGDKEPSAILTLSLLEQGLYDENKGDIPIIWSEEPASITHGSSEGIADAFRAVVKLPVRVREEDAVTSVSNQDIIEGVPLPRLYSGPRYQWQNNEYRV